jgi:hypothetical protein
MLLRDRFPLEKQRGMDVKNLLWGLSLIASWWIGSVSNSAYAQMYVAETEHFRVLSGDPKLSREIGEMAEEYRRHLAMHWLGKVLPPWNEKVPVVVHCSPRLLASGETKYVLAGGNVHQIQMVLSGTRERILDSVLPHELTHTVLATHFAATGKPVPRWADEGSCTTVEHISERSKHDVALVKFLSEGRGIPFQALFAMREYPRDMMPLYAEGYSLCAFLISQGGARRFVQFLERGMMDEDWPTAVAQYYGYPKLGKLQKAWNDWVADGGGTVANHTAVARGYVAGSAELASANGRPVDAGVRLAVAELPAPAKQPLQPISIREAGVAQVADPSSALARLTAGPTDPFLNNSMRSNGPSIAITRTSGYYQQQFEMHHQTPAVPSTNQTPAGASSRVGSVETPVSVESAQPAPFQTIGGTLYR